MISVTNLEWKLLNAYVGQGPIKKASLIFFGNEFGLANNNFQKYLKYIQDSVDQNQIHNFSENWEQGFTIKEPNAPENPEGFQCNSAFVRITAQFILALYRQDKKWLDHLSNKGNVYINHFILNHLHREDTCIFNMRPLPRPTENDWLFENINQNSYNKSLRFNSTGNIDKNIKPRVENLIRGFYAAEKSPLIIGTGDRHNKLNFFQRVLPKTDFSEIQLKSGKKIYLDINQKILLCDYFDYRVMPFTSIREIFEIIQKHELYSR